MNMVGVLIHLDCPNLIRVTLIFVYTFDQIGLILAFESDACLVEGSEIYIF